MKRVFGILALSLLSVMLIGPAAHAVDSHPTLVVPWVGEADSNTATVSITVTSENHAPVAVADTYSTIKDTSANLNVLTNDSDVDGDDLVAVKVTGPAHGVLAISLLDGSFVYMPDVGYTGPDSFTYHAYDGTVYSNTVTVTIAVTSPAVYVPVYRFYNVKTSVHFYTASETEKANVIANLSAIFHYEGVAYQINVANPQNSAPLYRFYNTKAGVHFYTASESEKNSVVANLSHIYKLEGVAYKVSLSSSNAFPIYRFYNFKKGVHFYTASETEKNNVLATLSWTYKLDGIGYYIGN